MRYITTEEYLDKYYEKYGAFYVMHQIPHNSKWLLYNSPEYKAYAFLGKRQVAHMKHREVLPDEVVLELDNPIKKENDAYAVKLCDRLRKWKIAYSRWNSGNKSNHIHLFFPELLKYELEDRKMLKKNLITYLCSGMMEKAGVDLNMVKKKQMIRAENSDREDGRGDKYHIDSFGDWENKIPSVIIDALKKQKAKELERQRKYQEYLKNNPHLKACGGEKCIEFIKSDDFLSLKDGRKQALFIYAMYLKKSASDHIYEELSQWNDYRLGRYFKDGLIKYQALRKECYSVSCRYIRENLLHPLQKDDVCIGCPKNITPK